MGTVLITGGGGFIGSYLCEQFLARGDGVICVDNFSSGSEDTIKHLRHNARFQLIVHDPTYPLNKELPSLTAILHFASPASPNPSSPIAYINHPVETLMVNSLGTKNMLDLADQHNCQIILASTSEVYGDPTVHPQPETYWGNVSPNGVRSCYDEGKRFLEAIAFAYHRSRGTKIKIARIFNTYGPRMRLDDGRFVPTIVDCIIHDKPFKQYGDGNASRSFCYIDDLVSGIVAMYDREVIGEVINLGNPTELSIQEATSVLEKIAGKKLSIEPQPALPDDPKMRRPDITKAKNLLGWEPKVGFEEGLRRMLEFYQ